MRVVRLVDIPVVVRIRRRAEIVVVVPAHRSRPEILAAAGLVLSTDEFTELQAAIADQHPTPDPPAVADRHESAGARSRLT